MAKTLSLFDGNGDSPGTGGGRGRSVLRVAALTRLVRLTLEEQWQNVWVEGELSDVSRASSGHIYFTLNDEQEPAQVRGVMFRADARRAKARIADGARVQIRGTLSLFEPRGAFQLIARQAVPAGLGDLHAAFERIREKLEAEGLLDPALKRMLPRVPRVVGVVTSAKGAAIHDIVRVASQRCPVRIVVAPCLVQGNEAPASIVSAIHAIQRLEPLDVVIVSRGGGSAEDLFAFNDERVARAIAACRVPTVSGVGHQVDVTIADLVADVRAATPSNAAEIVVPDREALVHRLVTCEQALQRGFERSLERRRYFVQRLVQRLGDPRNSLAKVRQRLDAFRGRLDRQAHRGVAQRRASLNDLTRRLGERDVRRVLAQDRQRLERLQARLARAAAPLVNTRRAQLDRSAHQLLTLGRPMVTQRRAQLAQVTTRLDGLSPLAILARGYAIVLDEAGRAVQHGAQVAVGERLQVRLHEGRLKTRVEEIE